MVSTGKFQILDKIVKFIICLECKGWIDYLFDMLSWISIDDLFGMQGWNWLFVWNAKDEINYLFGMPRWNFIWHAKMKLTICLVCKDEIDYLFGMQLRMK